MERILTLRELNRALLARQLLLERRKLAVPRAVERLCALQAQYSPSPYIALWSRLDRFREGQLPRALEQWLGVELPSREEGAKHLVGSYLAAFGPASQTDLLRFAGVRSVDVRAGLDQLELRTFRDERGRVLLDLPRAPLPGDDVPAPIRFLPKWDSSLLAYAPPERERILPDRFRKTVIKPNGDVVPTVLVDGFVAATWNIDKKENLEITPLRRLTRAERAEIDEEGERLREFVVG